jgi:hypothetical protein
VTPPRDLCQLKVIIVELGTLPNNEQCRGLCKMRIQQLVQLMTRIEP